MAEKPNSPVGFPTGLKCWIGFMVGLLLLGYPILLCISFGLIGGFAGGMIAAWLNAGDDGLPKRPKQPSVTAKTVVQQETTLQESARPRFQKYGMTGLRPREYQRPAVRRFGWLFRK
ncbi:MAG: hypothetical protein ACKO24_14370 [Leptolyngbyaceae cyanobacterium]